jgi:GTP-binding protein Era
MSFKSGFVNILGRPNVGKSTLMNALIGERLSIITPKAQTTRHRIIGILTTPNYQMVFSDTPGIIKPAYKLQSHMMNFVEGALTDADVFLYVVDVKETPEISDFSTKMLSQNLPVVLVINKIDLSNQTELESKVEHWKQLIPQAVIVPISANEKVNTDQLLKVLETSLPEGPLYFEEDALTDRTDRYFVSEIIREKILLFYEKEIPYSVEVVIDEFKEKPDIDVIKATVFVARDSQKGILIGHEGKKLKKLSTESRKSIEDYLKKKVYLDLNIKVNKDWRDSDQWLKRFGYSN